jgi:glycosyltransferase involved in cell wall biosynthesis
MRQLLPAHRVAWVNTIGTRPPKFNWATVKRGAGKIAQWLRPRTQEAEALPTNLQVVNPRMWPGFRTGWQRRLNAGLLTKSLLPVIAQMSQPVHAITTIPIVADLVQKLPLASWTYYCVDDFSVWPGLDGETLGAMEKALLPGMNCIIAASEHLQQRLLGLGYPSTLLTHGVDLAFWQTPQDTSEVKLLEGIERPIVIFWGVVDQRMDLAFIQQLAKEMTAGTIVLAGPHDLPHPELSSMSRVRLLGPLPLAQLPALAQQASVLIMPYADLPVTQAMQPLKLKEYLATGKPVVVRDLPANRAWRDCLDIVSDAATFSKLVLERIQTGIPPSQLQSREKLSSESWSSKANTFREIILQPKRVSA